MNSKVAKNHNKSQTNQSNGKCSVAASKSIKSIKSSNPSGMNHKNTNSNYRFTKINDSNTMNSNDGENDDMYRFMSGPDSYQLDEALHWSQAQFFAQFHLFAKRLPLEHLDNQLQLLVTLRRLLREHPYAGRQSVLERDCLAVFECLNQLLECDINQNEISIALIECLSLLMDLLVGANNIDCIDHPDCMPRILPRLIPQLGHPITGVRRACLRLLHTYIRHTTRLNFFIDTYIKFGLKANKSNHQKGCILSLPLLFTHEFIQSQEGIDSYMQTPNEPLNLFPLLQCLSELLVHADARLFYAIYLAIQRLHTLLGNNVFRLYLQRVNQEAAILYDKVLSRSGSGNTSLVNEPIHNAPDQYDVPINSINQFSTNDVNGNQSEGARTGDQTRTTSRMEPPEPDKYEQMVLNQLVSAEEEEIRKQSFELLSSPSSIINPISEFDNADESEMINTNNSGNNNNNNNNNNNHNGNSKKQDKREQLQQLQQQHLQQQSRASNRNDNDMLSSTSDTNKNNHDHNQSINNQSKLNAINMNARTYGHESNAEHIRRAEWETKKVLQQIGTEVNERMPTMFELNARHVPTSTGCHAINGRTQPEVNNSLNCNRRNDGTETHLMYGLFPNRLIERSMSSQVAIKNESINQMLTIVKQAPCAQLTIFSSAQHFVPFVNQILIRLLEHPNFKVTLQALEIVQTLIIRLKHQLLSHLPLIVSAIVRRLADSRVVVRQQTVHTFQLLTAKLPAQSLLEQLLIHVHSRSGRLRAEILNRVLALLLQVPRDQFNLCALCHRLPPLLLDCKRSVRLAALECAAVLAHCLGPNRQRRLLECVNVLQHVQKADGLLAAVRARLARRDLPRLSADGQIRYALNPTGFAAWYPSAADADIEWVLQGSTSAGSTPPSRSIESSNVVTIPYTTDGNLCSMKRGSCALAGTNHDLFESNSYRYRQVLVDNIEPPPDTAAKASDCTVDIERLIEKNTIDQLKSRELSTGDSQYSIHSQQCGASNLKNDYDMLQLNHSFDEDDQGFDFETLQHHYQKSMYDNRSNAQDEFNISCSINNPKRFESSIDVTKMDKESMCGSNLRHSRTHSMPAIAPSQLSDISERSEFVSQYQNNLTNALSCNDHMNEVNLDFKSSPNDAGDKDANKLNIPNSKQGNRRLSLDSNNENSSKSSNENSNIDCKSNANNENNTIEINVQRASTISDDSKSMQVPDFNQLGSELHQRKKSIQPPKTENTNHKRMSLCATSKEQNDIANQANDSNSNTSKQSNANESQSKNDADKYETCESPQNTHQDQSAIYLNLNDANKNKPIKSMIPVQASNCARDIGLTLKELDSGIVPPTPPNHHHNHQHQLVRIQPAIPSNANIRNILENVTKTEGPFKEPEEALKAAISAFTQDAWTTKVEGMLAVNRLALFHPNVLKKELHTIVLALAYEVKNLRSTVARSAIFTLADLLKKMKGHIDPEMDIIAQALLHKCGENIQFIRDDIEKSLENFITYMPPVRAALCIIHHGTNHRNILVRRIAANYLADLIETMGATKALLGPRDLAESLLPSAAALLLDRDPQARHSARRIFNVLMNHSQFNTLLGKHVQPAVYRTIIGTLQSIRRRGVGERPSDNTNSNK